MLKFLFDRDDLMNKTFDDMYIDHNTDYHMIRRLIIKNAHKK